MKHYAPIICLPLKITWSNFALLYKMPKLEKVDNSDKYSQNFAKS